MRVIAHLSDLHFGTEVENMVRALEQDLKSMRPDVLAISGDLTQRARKRQFTQARRFLDALPVPRVVVPGNHDIPLFNLPARYLNPFGGYRAYFSWDLSPSYVDSEIAVFGFNTVRARRWKEGRLAQMERARLSAFLKSVPQEVFKVVVTHHSLIPFPGDTGILGLRRRKISRKHKQILEDLEAGQADLVLAGHLHRGVSGDAREHHPALGRAIVFAEAGTAISTRRRKELNSYNRILIGKEEVIVETRLWDKTAFRPGRSKIYPRGFCLMNASMEDLS